MEHIRDMIANEKLVKSLQTNKDKAAIDEIKQQNKDRVKQGLNPIYLKKRDIKEHELKTKFDKLDKSGRLDKFMEDKAVEYDKKRYRK